MKKLGLFSCSLVILFSCLLSFSQIARASNFINEEQALQIGPPTYEYSTTVRTDSYPPSSLFLTSVSYQGSLYYGYIYRTSVYQDPDTYQYFGSYKGILTRYQ